MAERTGPPAAGQAQSTVHRTLDLLWLIARRQLRLGLLLFGKEVQELLVSRALWAMVFIGALLVGFSFIQAVHLYSDASATAAKLPQLAVNQNPLDGIVIRVFAAVYLMNTFLFPFVAIRAIGNEKQTGALKFALQLPVGIYGLIGIKLAALFVGWAIALIPTASALAIWSLLLGGHLYWPELASVLLGHVLYALVIAGVSFLAAALTESAATAAIVALAFTLGSWILEFAGATATGIVRAIAGFSLTPALRGLEQGLVGSPTALALAVLALGFLALTVVWLPTGASRREKLLRSGAVAGVAFQALLLAIQLPIYKDVTEDQRNSFNPADVRALGQMAKELKVNVNLATNDPHFLDLQRNVLSKLQRTAPHVTITYAETSTSSLLGGTSGASYGLNTYTYAGKQGSSRATTAREVLPLIETLGGLTVTPDPVKPYRGFPLVTSADGAAVWFYGLLPALAIVGWWFFQQPPDIPGWVRAQRTHVRSRWPRLAPYLPGIRRAALMSGAAFVAVQFIPYGRDHTDVGLPIETGTPTWDSHATQQLALRACAACHSNTPGWSWYGNIAPLSWAVQHNVDAGRAAMNLSEWDAPQPLAQSAARSVQNGSMPPAWAALVDSRMRLTTGERADLVRGLSASFNTTRYTAIPAQAEPTPLPQAVSPQSATLIAEDFTEETVGAAPTSFSTPLGWWSMGTDGVHTKPVLFEDGTRYSTATGTTTLAAQAQAQAQGETNYQVSDVELAYFPVAIFNKVSNFTHGTVVTRFAIVGGDLDTDAGIVFNYHPTGEFMALRGDLDAGSLILFSFSQGVQTNLSVIQNVPADMARWHELRLSVPPGGTHVTGTFDGQRLLDYDLSAPISGQVGAITRTDTVAIFDSLTVDPNGQ